MPRFLHTYTGEFCWVEDPSKVIYAILSHTWRSKAAGGEQSYVEIQELRRRHALEHPAQAPTQPAATLTQLTDPFLDSHFYVDRGSDTNPDPGSILSGDTGLSDKIKEACRFAREAGYQLIWIDSGCIDKSSSAELTEAINSMFELYRLASVCFVYLADVSHGDDPWRLGSDFRKSRWHTRGWTLQELIAPTEVVFLDKSWSHLGTKVGLASTLEQVTRISFDILTGRAPLSSVSVARRMSWAATRETTRIEDEAYSLLGIFGVHLSPIYGEGSNAFLRLQEEIIRNIPDQTIFAWGNTYLQMNSLDDIVLHTQGAGDPHHWNSLLAPSTKPFFTTGDIVPLTPTAFTSRLGLTRLAPPLNCVFTPQGVRITLLSVDCSILDFRQTAVKLSNASCNVAECTLHSCAIQYLALLQCQATSTGSIVALALLSPPGVEEQGGPLRVATTLDCGCAGWRPCRLVYLHPDVLGTPRHFRTLDASILRITRPLHPERPWGLQVCGPYSGTGAISVALSLWQDTSPTDFRIAPWCAERLRVFGFTFAPLSRVFHTEPDGIGASKTELTTALTSSSKVLSDVPRPQTFVQTIFVKLTLAKVNWRRGDDDTRSQFAIGNNFCTIPVGHTEARTHDDFYAPDNKSFHSAAIHITARERAIHQAVFVLPLVEDIVEKVGPQLQTPRQRALRLSLECPHELLYSMGTSSRLLPYVYLSAELSDVFTAEMLSHTDQGQSHGHNVPHIFPTPRPQADLRPEELSAHTDHSAQPPASSRSPHTSSSADATHPSPEHPNSSTGLEPSQASESSSTYSTPATAPTAGSTRSRFPDPLSSESERSTVAQEAPPPAPPADSPGSSFPRHDDGPSSSETSERSPQGPAVETHTGTIPSSTELPGARVPDAHSTTRTSARPGSSAGLVRRFLENVRARVVGAPKMLVKRMEARRRV